jgi:hypothetical protein
MYYNRYFVNKITLQYIKAVICSLVLNYNITNV